MRKNTTLSLMAVAMLLFSSCSQGPAEALKEYMKVTQDGDYKALFEGINPNCARMKEALANDSNFYEHFVEVNKREFGKRNGVKDFTILDTDISEKGDSAVVKYTVTFGNGAIDTTTQNMVKVNGKWYMDE